MVVVADMIHSRFPSAGAVRLNAEGGFGTLRREEDPGKGSRARPRHFPVVLSLPRECPRWQIEPAEQLWRWF
jgi:hypothetical protein